jgi:hypothetical protein
VRDAIRPLLAENRTIFELWGEILAGHEEAAESPAKGFSVSWRFRICVGNAPLNRF